MSDQWSIDFTSAYENSGCEGGFMGKALKFVKDHGICASEEYH